MKVLAIIPARYASTRFPGKPLADIAGKPMIQRVYEKAQSCQLLSEVIVATDDENIFKVVKAFGGNVQMTAASHQSGTDRCNEVLQKVNTGFDVVVNIQGDEPTIQSSQIEALIRLFENPSIHIGTLAKPIDDLDEIENPNVVKVVFNHSKIALYFSRSIIPYPRDKEAKNNSDFFKHIGMYAYRSEILAQIAQLPQSKLEITESLEQLRWLDNGYSVGVGITNIENKGIDTPEDLAKLLEENIF